MGFPWWLALVWSFLPEFVKRRARRAIARAAELEAADAALTEAFRKGVARAARVGGSFALRDYVDDSGQLIANVGHYRRAQFAPNEWRLANRYNGDVLEWLRVHPPVTFWKHRGDALDFAYWYMPRDLLQRTGVDRDPRFIQ